ncbi:MAG TPA: proline dehydrogenase family protein [Bacteroidota bacterium]|nr:proline dehydrogenase family protein [Bacteroidota bacterium]
MNFLNRLIVSTLPAVPKPIVRKFANRYIAGEEMLDAVRAVRHLNDQRYLATVDVLGEDITERSEAVAARDAILEVLQTITDQHLDSNVSVKLTQVGLKLDKNFCLENTRAIVTKAAESGNFLRIDMEDSTCTDDTIWVYRQLRKDFSNVGIVLQAYLHRTLTDAESLMSDGIKNFRLCKGIYIESESIAYKTHDAINENYKNVLRTMLESGAYVGIATHDDKLVDAAYGMIRERNMKPSEYEFQMLLGVRPELRAQILNNGHRLRVYVPFGKKWYQYSLRRFKENPQVAGYVLKALFTSNSN